MSDDRQSRRTRFFLAGFAVALSAGLAATPSAFAQVAPTPAPAPVAAPKPPAAKPAPRAAKSPVPLKLTLVAKTPDPPWFLRIENTGDRPVRVPADIRLLALELRRPADPNVKHAKVKELGKCKAPESLKPNAFPKPRELFLKPGEAWEEPIDPRLYCFGALTDRLTGGLEITPKFGWSHAFGAAKEPFAAEPLDRPSDHAPLKEITGEVLTLPGFPPPPPPVTIQASTTKEAASTKPARPKYGEAPERVTDRNAEQLDVYIERFADAHAPRDIVISFRAVNEGQRKLIAALRGRMITFVVDELDRSNRAIHTFECRGSVAPHAIPAEGIASVRPGQAVHIPLLLAELCPKDAFERPGLYRVRAEMDTTAGGEALERDTYMAEALAKQSALVRVASARKGFYEGEPRPLATRAKPKP